MKKFIHIFYFLAAVCLSLTTCVKYEINGNENEVLLKGPALSFEISIPGAVESNISQTKSQGSGVENKVSSITYAIWPDDETDGAPVVSGTASVSAPNGTGQVYVGLSESEVERLYPNNTPSCTVFVIANYPGSISGLDAMSLSDLRSRTSSANFLQAQDSFVMTYEGKANVTNKRAKVVGVAHVALARLAAKFTLKIKIADHYEETFPDGPSRMWYPDPLHMSMKFYNCAGKARLDASSENRDQSKFNYTEEDCYFTNQGGTYNWTSNTMYTYPKSWESGPADEPYMVVILPWYYNTENGGTATKYFFYKVIVPGSSIDRNTWHNINLNIGLLGNLSEDYPRFSEEEIPELHYYVENWNLSIISGGGGGQEEGGDHDVDATISDARYLVVSKNTYVINNLDELQIPFASSHNCNIGKFEDGSTTAIIQASRPNYQYTSVGTSYSDAYDPAHPTDPNNWLRINMETHMIEFVHPLNNNTSKSGYDYVPYTLKFRIQHADDHRYYEEITITQYPALYILAEVNSTGADAANKAPQNTIVNNDDAGNYGGRPYSSTNRGNHNGYMYIVTTTVLGDSSIILADPRTREVDIRLGGTSTTWSSSAASVQGGANRRLTYYYPSRQEEARFMIAPKFRIASSYGACSAISFENAQKRCASYQEAGYPAGRWRVPTRAEVKYMAKLSGDGCIPTLLSDTSTYWCSDGSVCPNYGSPEDYYDCDSDATHNVRCVYDEWYWSESQYPKVSPENTFKWGDEER